MLLERERQKQEEYNQRKDVDIEELGMSEQELATMKELDYMYGGSTTKEELAEMEEEENQKVIEPFLQKKKRFIKHQEFRTITVGPEDLLKNGQMI
jgi:excinuclease UvrABC helicase subunit UvrB